MTDAAAPLLEVSELGYAYGERVAVDGVGFTLARGEVLGLLGPNGAGKTTAISCICGLLTPRSGSLRFQGRPFEPHRTAADRVHLGVVPQELALYDGLSARQNLRFFGSLHGLEAKGGALDEAVDRGLSLSGLASRADDKVKTFSGGMKRRLNLAVAMLGEPELALLDEPMVGVDPQSRHHIFESIEQLKTDGRGMLYTSHSMDEVERLCDRIAILDGGRLVATGTADELATQAGLDGADLEKTFLELTGHSLRDGG